jgi:glycosyltransferase involved in cell wall biosynthesis
LPLSPATDEGVARHVDHQNAFVPIPLALLGAVFLYLEYGTHCSECGSLPGETKVKIAQIAPLAESVPPRMYGGTERIVSYLTEELVRLGHEVTLFASGDSVTSANLVSCAKKALRLDTAIKDIVPYYMLMLDRVRQNADEFDILHFHIDHFHVPTFRSLAAKTVTTLHGRQDLPDNRPLYCGFDDFPLVSISNDQRRPIPQANFAATVYHGLPKSLLRPTFEPQGGYLAFLGRIAPEKRPDRAIAMARQAGIPLKIAAKVDKVDEAYFRESIQPLLNHQGVEFIGEINEQDKSKFLGEANGLLFPIDWPEPFGLVMIEAMACGTPVLAFNKGSVTEIVEPGITGFLVDSVEEANGKLDDLLSLDRRLVRKRFEERFSASRMARDYAKLYHQLLESSEKPVSIPRGHFGSSNDQTLSRAESWRIPEASASRVAMSIENLNDEI